MPIGTRVRWISTREKTHDDKPLPLEGFLVSFDEVFAAVWCFKNHRIEIVKVSALEKI